MEDLQLKLPAEIQQTHFRGLDGLRGVSILLVIFSHVAKLFPGGNNYFGKIGVYIFFVISGFLITTLLLKERLKYGKISLKGFYLRRVFRILPVVFLYLIVLALLNIIYNLNISGTSFLASFFFVRNLIAGDIYTDHFWSLAIEEQFYLIFPFFIVWLSLGNYKRLILWVIALITLLSFVYIRRLDTGCLHVPRVIHLMISLVYKLFANGTVLILIGSLFSVLFVSQNKMIKLICEKAPGLTAPLLFILGIVILYPTLPWHVPLFSAMIFGIMMAVVIILNLKEGSLFGRLLENNFIRRIGILSYSLYIWQQLFTGKQPWYHSGTNILLITANLIALGIVSWLSYSLYERKFLAYKDRFKRV